MSTPDERLRRTVFGRQLSVHMPEGMERRLRAYIDRYNHVVKRMAKWHPDDLMDPNNDEDLASAYAACCDRGLEDDEQDHGLVGTDWGELMPKEQVEEIRRRRLAQRARPG